MRRRPPRHEREVDDRDEGAAARRLRRLGPKALVEALMRAANVGDVARAKVLGRELAERLGARRGK